MGGGVEKTKNKIGFTLAELLAVIAILGVIALIAFPAVNKVIKNSKEKAYTTQKEIILSSAKNWAIDHINDLSESDNTYLSIEKLKQGGYLEAKQVVNPITEEEMNGCIVISYDSEYNQFIYNYNETSCIKLNDIPVITLNGDKTITISLNGTYTELGATAKYKDQNITSSIITTGSVDTTKVGTYTIRYNVTYNNKKAKEVSRTIKVMDQNPLIELSPNGTDGYKKATTVRVIVTPSEANTITSLTYQLDEADPQDVVNNQITLDTDGEHILIVTATDNQGNTKTITSETYYIDVTPPTITFAEGDLGITLKPSEVESYGLKTGVTIEDNHEITLNNVTTSGELSAIEGSYTITYTATDTAGNSTTKDRTVTVKKATTVMGQEVDEDQIMTNDPDGNLRYVGTDPDNYVRFNNELWRIIGVFDGQAKIIRNEPSNTAIAWDTNNVSDWSISTLKTQLNTTFLNNIDTTSKSYIDSTHIWNLGEISGADNIRATFYNKERGTEVYSGRPTTWTGAIGLIYPSDYGYSTSSTNDVCNTANMNSWSTSSNATAYSECAQKSWLYNSSYDQWTLTTYSGANSFAFYIEDGAIYIVNGFPNKTILNSTPSAASPVLYLKSNVKIFSGEGTQSNPYTLIQESDDPDHNPRFTGSNPNNYVQFNNELWRVIGIFDGQMKLIRNEPYSTSVAWDTNNTNDWSQATIQTELNTTFLNNIETTSKLYIDGTHIWNLGAAGYSVNRSTYYRLERGNRVYGGRPITWTGAIGLMYVSDYGYSPDSTNEICDTRELVGWYSSDESTTFEQCAQTSWLYNSKNQQWTLTPRTNFAAHVYTLNPNGCAYTRNANDTNTITASPAIYLNKNVKITSGFGTQSNPFILGL